MFHVYKLKKHVSPMRPCVQALLFLMLTILFTGCGEQLSLAAEPSAAASTAISPPQETPTSACHQEFAEQKKALQPSIQDDVEKQKDIPFYTITFQSDITSLNYSGHEQICYTNRTGKVLENLVIRLYPNRLGGQLQTSNITIDGKPVEGKITQEPTYMTITLPAPLVPRATTIVEMNFQGKLANANGAMPNDGYSSGEISYMDNVLYLSNFYPQVGIWQNDHWDQRPMFPEYADPTYAESSFFNVTLIVPGAQKILSVGVEADSKQQGSQIAHRFVTGPVREFAALMSDQYEIISRQVNGITFRSAYTLNDREQGKSRAEEALEIGIEAVQTYSEYLAPFPFVKMDYGISSVETRGFEKPGLVALSRLHYLPHTTALLRYPTGAAIPANPIDYRTIVTHETAHTWWYGLVSNDQIAQPWIDEGLATYVTYLEPEWHARQIGQNDSAIQNIRQAANNLIYSECRTRYTQIHGDVIINQPPADLLRNVPDSQQYLTYLLQTYDKPSCFYNAFRTRYGDQALNTFFHLILEQHRHQLIQPAHLLEAMQEAVPAHNEEIQTLFQRWTEEKHLLEDLA